MLWYKLYNLYVLWPSSKNRAHVTDEKLGYNDMHKANPNITKSCVKWPFIYSPYIQLHLSRSVILRYKGHLCSKRRGFCGSLQNTPLQIFYFILWRIFFSNIGDVSSDVAKTSTNCCDIALFFFRLSLDTLSRWSLITEFSQCI